MKRQRTYRVYFTDWCVWGATVKARGPIEAEELVQSLWDAGGTDGFGAEHKLEIENAATDDWNAVEVLP